MKHNDLKKGDRVRLPGLFGKGPRIATVMDNQKGVTRLLKIDESNGHFPDIGSTYVDEILDVSVGGIWEPIEISDTHQKQMRKIRSRFF